MHDHQYTNMGNSIQEILGKTWDETKEQYIGEVGR